MADPNSFQAVVSDLHFITIQVEQQCRRLSAMASLSSTITIRNRLPGKSWVAIGLAYKAKSGKVSILESGLVIAEAQNMVVPIRVLTSSLKVCEVLCEARLRLDAVKRR